MRAPSLIVLASLLTVSVGHADPVTESVHVTYEAPSGCPTAEEFVAEVHARTPRATVTLDSAPAQLEIAVSISAADEASSGHLQIKDDQGGETVRAVTGDTCGEVAAALVLVAALAIDPNAALPAPPPIAPVPPPPPSRFPPSVESALPPSDDGSDVGSNPAPSGRVAVSAGPAEIGGIAPSLLPGVSAAVGLALRLGPLSPVLRLGFAWASGGANGDSAPTASFTWSSGTFDGCPHRFKVAAVTLEPCVRVEAGAVNAAGSNVVPTRETTRAWVAVGAAGRAEWPIAEPLFVELEAGARAPIIRPRYIFEPDSQYYRSPVVAGFASAGVGLHFL